MLNVLIIGSGFVGFSLGHLLSKKYSVTLTTRSEEKFQSITSSGLHPLLLDTKDKKRLKTAIEDKDIIIVCLAPKSSQDYESTYLATAKNLREALSPHHRCKMLTYTSSSSVYGDHQGQVTDEESKLLGKSKASQILIETEKIYLSLEATGIDICLLRLSEIYGPGREISKRVKTLSEISAPGDGLNPTNMIHLDDICSSVVFVIENRLRGIYNLCDDDHLPRKEMYDKVSHKKNLPQVIFDPEKTSIHSGKKVLSNEKIKKAGYLFKRPDRVFD